jgi:hypothetical protein
VLETYDSQSIKLYANCLNTSGISPDVGPTIIENKYVEYTFNLVNEKGLPQGNYPILVFCGMSNPYLDGIEQNWWRNALFHQILWVTVES